MAVLRGTFITMRAYIKKTERSQINDLMLHIKLLKNKNCKSQNKQKERNNKNRAKINEIETNKQKNHTKNQ
jgi:hypothetical protein